MSWFILFAMMQAPHETGQELYTVTSMAFMSEEECVEFVGENNRILKDHILTVYPIRPVSEVYCVRQDVLNKIMKNYTNKES